MEAMKKVVAEARKGRIAPYAIAWLIGVPIPILLIIYMARGCQ